MNHQGQEIRQYLNYAKDCLDVAREKMQNAGDTSGAEKVEEVEKKLEEIIRPFEKDQ